MKYTKRKMTQTDAKTISKWRYDKPYEIYSFKESQEVIDELINQNYYTIYNEDKLVGYYCVGSAAQVPNDISKEVYKNTQYVDIGLGMKPDLTGNGRGMEFVEFIINSAEKDYPDKNLRLTVAEFNKRAAKVYKQLGFIEHVSFLFEKSNTQFVIMLRN